MSATEPRAEEPVVCDTVVVNYFLAVGRIEILADAVGGSALVPRAVFDPEEPDGIGEEALSELRRGLRLHERRARDPEVEDLLRARSQRALPHFQQLPELARSGLLQVTDLSNDELELYVRFRDPHFTIEFEVPTGLGSGEAAVLALAQSRGWRVATDDQDAIKVGTGVIRGFRPLRIRSLLKLAVDARLVTLSEARMIHREMKEAGFWDKGRL